MKIIDIFNGDADGICSLIQLRLNTPLDSELVTGVKRNIDLLNDLSFGKGDQVTVLDISMLKNMQGLTNALNSGAQVFYADHHQSGDIPDHPGLSAHINPSPEVCTGLIVNAFLKNQYILWALTAAYGDNLIETANTIGKKHNIGQQQLDQLHLLGTYINYNGYGATLEDLLFHPAELFKTLLCYESPLDFIEEKHATYVTLEEGYQSDFANAENAEKILDTESVAAFLLPDQRWARRVSGVFGNSLANQFPNRAHAVLTEQEKEGEKGYLVSIRAPLLNKQHADTLASQFPTGGGRKGAAGINHLPEELLGEFLSSFKGQYSD